MIDFVYIINSNFYTKHIKNKNGKYLPFFDTDIKQELIKKNILIYTKSFGFNGIITILKIIDNNNSNYKILIGDYCLGSSNNLYFFEIDNIHLFNRSYKYRDYFNYCKTNKSKYINFSMYDDLIITKNYSSFFDDFMLKITETPIEIHTETQTVIPIETPTEIQTETPTEKKENQKISFRIPILWIPCLELLDIIERKRISKKIFRNHYSNCSSCQFTNNNHNLHLTFDSNYKVNLINHFSIINYYNYYNDPKNNLDNSNTTSSDSSLDTGSESLDSSSDTEYTNDLDEYKYDSENDIMYYNEESKTVDRLIERIIRCYSTCMNYEEEVENIKLIGLENGMYNILYYNNINEDHIYNNSLFIIK